MLLSLPATIFSFIFCPMILKGEAGGGAVGAEQKDKRGSICSEIETDSNYAAFEASEKSLPIIFFFKTINSCKSCVGVVEQSF